MISVAPASSERRIFRIGRFLRMVVRVTPVALAFTILLRLGVAGLPALNLWLGKEVIDTLVLGASTGFDDSIGALTTLVAAQAAAFIFGDLIGRVIALVEAHVGDVFSHHSSVLLMRHAAHTPYHRYEDPEFADRVARARKQTRARVALIPEVLAGGQQAVTLVSLIAVLSAFDPILLPLLALSVAPMFLGETRHAGERYSFMYQWTQQRRLLDYLRWLGTARGTIKDVKLMGLTEEIIRRFDHLAKSYIRENRWLSVRRATSALVLGGVTTLTYFGAVAYLGAETLAGALTIGSFTMLSGALTSSRGIIQSLFGTMVRLYDHNLQLQDFFGFIDSPIESADSPGTADESPERFESLQFNDVFFRYPGAESWALSHVSFTLSRGEFIGIVGRNGSGKSTVIKLALGLLEPTSGAVLLNGRPVADFDPAKRWSIMSVVFQDFTRFEMTARENIAFGDHPKVRRDTELVDALADLGGEALIQNLSEGLDQVLGRRFDSGVDLSGGEWQKVALARGLLGSQSLVVLDEPAAALDTRTELALASRLQAIRRDRAVIVISHRFSMVTEADRILVFKGGRLIQTGTHDVLASSPGEYHDLYSASRGS